MKDNIHVMVDLETLGTKEGATIFQIAASVFNMETGELGDSINLIADIEKLDLIADGSTLKWWLNTNKELLAKLVNEGSISEEHMLDMFGIWIICRSKTKDMKDVYLWGNGILFDNAKIQGLYRKYNRKYPIYYKNDRDVRTLVELACERVGMTEHELKETVPSEGESHDALNDVRWQAKLVSKCYNIITTGGSML